MISEWIVSLISEVIDLIDLGKTFTYFSRKNNKEIYETIVENAS